MTRFVRLLAAALIALASGVAQAQNAGLGAGNLTTNAPEGTPAAQQQEIDHLAPRRDSVGPVPVRFEWTPVKGADSYAIGVWSEVDVLMWKQSGITESWVARPADVQLTPGTYFWSVVALSGGRQIADSGQAAFVVKE